MKNRYLALCIIGTLLPLGFFVPFLREHGLNLRLMVTQLFANPTAAFFGMDVLVSSVVLWTLVLREGRGLKYRWLPLVANLVVGVSLGLPLFLYLRERGSHLENELRGHTG